PWAGRRNPFGVETQDSELNLRWAGRRNRFGVDRSVISPTQHSALSTRDLALSTRHSALATQHSALGTQHSALSTRHSALSTSKRGDYDLDKSGFSQRWRRAPQTGDRTTARPLPDRICDPGPSH